MKKAIKVLEKRIEALNNELLYLDLVDEADEFIRSDLENMKLEKTELQEAIKLLNKTI
jgi:prefoldin subunit 5